MLFIFGYASAFRFLLWDEEGFENFGESIVTVFRMSIGGESGRGELNLRIDCISKTLTIARHRLRLPLHGK
jgi:hypothetical protein